MPTFCAVIDTTGGGHVYGTNGDVVLAANMDGPPLSPGGTPATEGAGAIPGPGGTPGPLVSIPEGVTPGPPPFVVDRTPGTPGPVGGTTPGPARRGEYPNGVMFSLGRAGEGFRGSGKGPTHVEEDGRGAFNVDIEGEFVEGGPRGGDDVSGRGNCDKPFGAEFEKRCGTGVWKRSGARENGTDGTFDIAGPDSPGPGVQPCRGEEAVEEMV